MQPLNSRNFKILIVEDEQIWQEILSERVSLELATLGFDTPVIQLARSYEEARGLIEDKNGWDLLIADLTLDFLRPDLGKNWGQIIIARAQTLKIPAIVVSATANSWDTRNLLLRYAVKDCFEKKDFTAQQNEFGNIIRDILSGNSLTNLKLENKSNLPFSDSTYSGQERFALLIGIANYLHISGLNKTVIDVQDMYTTLTKSGYDPKNIRVLTDENATYSAISHEMDWIARKANSDSTVTIFFSGHGLRRVGGFKPGDYLCPVEASLSSLEESCIPSDAFTNALNAISAERLVFFIDACHSGGVGNLKDFEHSIKSGLSEDVYTQFSQQKGRAIIASCRAEEVSWELPGFRNGLFTHYLLEGLRTGAVRLNETISIMGLFDYISDKVPQHRSQHPVMKSNTENFIVAIRNSFAT